MLKVTLNYIKANYLSASLKVRTSASLIASADWYPVRLTLSGRLFVPWRFTLAIECLFVTYAIPDTFGPKMDTFGTLGEVKEHWVEKDVIFMC